MRTVYRPNHRGYEHHEKYYPSAKNIYMHNMPWFLFYEYPVFITISRPNLYQAAPMLWRKQKRFIDSQEVLIVYYEYYLSFKQHYWIFYGLF